MNLITLFFLRNIDISTQNSLTTRFSYPSHLLFFQNKMKFFPKTMQNYDLKFFFLFTHNGFFLSHFFFAVVFLTVVTKFSFTTELCVYFFPSANQYNYLCIYSLCCAVLCCCTLCLIKTSTHTVNWLHQFTLTFTFTYTSLG